MNIETIIQNKLKTELSPIHLEVINESHNHSGPSTQSHFKIIVVSAKFQDMMLLQRHRLINKLLAQELQQIHALAMHTYTKDEWLNKGKAPTSPLCRGGSK